MYIVKHKTNKTFNQDYHPMSVEQMAPAPEQAPNGLPPVDGFIEPTPEPSLGELQAAYDEQMQANAELTRKREAEQYAKAYVDAQEHFHANPEAMPFGEDEVRNASGWDAKVHVVAHRAGEEAIAEHRRGIEAGVARNERARAFTASREGDDWDASTRILDHVRADAEAAELTDPGNPKNWEEFDTLYSQLSSGEGRAYTSHVDQQTAEAKKKSADDEEDDWLKDLSDDKPAEEAKTDTADDEKTPDPSDDEKTDDTTEADDDDAEDDDTDESDDAEKADDDEADPFDIPLDTPQPRRGDGRADDRYTFRGFRTWTERELEDARARQGGEHVPERDRPLENNYFHQIEDLNHEGLEYVELLARTNENLANGTPTSHEDRDRLDELADTLNGSSPGLADKLNAVYGAYGEFVNPRGDVNSTRLTPDDAEFINLLHQYKGMERNGRIRKQIRELYEKIHGSEGEIPVNWRRRADGTIVPVEGGFTKSKADWLIDRHAGPRHHAVFELIAEGGMEAPIGNPARLRQRLGNAALRYTGINAVRRRMSRGRP
jgi:hypothetical protein